MGSFLLALCPFWTFHVKGAVPPAALGVWPLTQRHVFEVQCFDPFHVGVVLRCRGGPRPVYPPLWAGTSLLPPWPSRMELLSLSPARSVHSLWLAPFFRSSGPCGRGGPTLCRVPWFGSSPRPALSGLGPRSSPSQRRVCCVNRWVTAAASLPQAASWCS